MTALWAALFAGFVAILATLAVEKLGGVLGGVVASIPTTVVPGVLGFFYAGAGFEQAVLAIPYGMFVNAVFLLTWRVLPTRLPFVGFQARLLSMILMSLLIWFCCAGVSVWIQHQYSSLHMSAIVVVVQALFGIWACWNNPPAPKGTNPVGMSILAMRGLLAGTAIGCAILMSHLGALAGMASVFPAIFLTTMVSVWMAQGEAVPAGAVGPMMLGSTSVSLFSVLSILLLGLYGPIIGCLLSWGISVILVSVPAAIWLRHLSKSKEE